jgi:polyhydroxybutyrate depolymerase
MKKVAHWIAAGLAAWIGLSVHGARAQACHDEIPCRLGDRSYHVLEPDGWDGMTPLPVMMHFHGWARTGVVVVNHGRIAGATRPRGVLLVAPNGRNKTWDFWFPDSPDTAFADAVLADVAKRYPIDPAQIFVSGYSYGSAMAWRFACESTTPLRALLAVAGALTPDETCAQAPLEVRHTHGLDDRVLGFPFGPDGDVTGPVILWRDRLGCASAPEVSTWNAVSWLTFTRYGWACDAGRVVLDVHPASHLIPRGWFAAQLDALLEPPGQ